MTKPRLDQGVDYERGFIDGMQKQMQSSVDKAVNRMAQPKQEPVAWISHNAGLYHGKPDKSLNPLPLYLAPPPCPTCEALAQPEQEPVGKLQEPTAERSWFTIAELNAWADKKLSENPHWVMPKDEPERDEPPPPQRTWVGLTAKEKHEFRYSHMTTADFIDAIEAKLKDKNL